MNDKIKWKWALLFPFSSIQWKLLTLDLEVNEVGPKTLPKQHLNVIYKFLNSKHHCVVTQLKSFPCWLTKASNKFHYKTYLLTLYTARRVDDNNPLKKPHKRSSPLWSYIYVCCQNSCQCCIYLLFWGSVHDAQ